MRLRALMIGFLESRARKAIAAIEAASSARLEIKLCRHHDEYDPDGADEYAVIFVNGAIDHDSLDTTLRCIRRHDKETPLVITYESQPDGRLFLLAKRYDCWLFSDRDRLNRALTPAEIGETLALRSQWMGVERRLMEMACFGGPCSTGS